MNGSDRSISTIQLYGSVIAIVSGGYSMYLATTGTGTGMTGAAWFMLVLGVVVALHGVVLVTPLAARLGAASGPLMIAYAVLMLLNQAWMASMDDPGMNGMNGMDDMNSMGSQMGWDAGMIAIALLMLASGVIMTARRGTMRDEGRMD